MLAWLESVYYTLLGRGSGVLNKDKGGVGHGGENRLRRLILEAARLCRPWEAGMGFIEGRTGLAEGRFYPALGYDRGLWPQRLKAAVSKEEGSQSHAKAARLPTGKGRVAGGHRRPLWTVGARQKPGFNRLRKRLGSRLLCS